MFRHYGPSELKRIADENAKFRRQFNKWGGAGRECETVGTSLTHVLNKEKEIIIVVIKKWIADENEIRK